MKNKNISIIIPAIGTVFLLLLSGFINSSRQRGKNIVEDYNQRQEAREHLVEADYGRNLSRKITDVQGETQDNLYNNTALSFNVSVPENWHILSEEEMQEYIRTTDSNRWTFESYTEFLNERDTDDEEHYWDEFNEGAVYLFNGYQYYDMICTNDEQLIFSIFFLYENVYFELNDILINNIINESQNELDNNPDITAAIHDSPVASEINGNSVSLINWTITRSDGSVYYRTEIIDYCDSFVRVISVDYNEPSELDDFTSRIAYNNNTN